MTHIMLSRGMVAVVDGEDYDALASHRWHASGSGRYVSAARWENGVLILMHRQILGLRPADGRVVDHINHDTLDNRKANLRACSAAGNNQNARPHNPASGYKGVYLDSHTSTVRPWRAQIEAMKTRYRLGTFATPEEAAHAYDIAARELHGEFAYPNFP